MVVAGIILHYFGCQGSAREKRKEKRGRWKLHMVLKDSDISMAYSHLPVFLHPIMQVHT